MFTLRNALLGACWLLLGPLGRIEAGDSISIGTDSADDGTVEVNQHALLRLNVHIQVNGIEYSEVSFDAVAKQLSQDIQWIVYIDEVSLPYAPPPQESTDIQSSIYDVGSSTSTVTLVEIQEMLSLEWSPSPETGTIQGYADVSFLLPLLEENPEDPSPIHTRKLLVALWERHVSSSTTKIRKNHLLARRLAQVPRTRIAFERQRSHQVTASKDETSSRDQLVKPYTVAELVATSRCCSSVLSQSTPMIKIDDHSFTMDKRLLWCAVAITTGLLTMLVFAMKVRHSPVHAETETRQGEDMQRLSSTTSCAHLDDGRDAITAQDEEDDDDDDESDSENEQHDDHIGHDQSENAEHEEESVDNSQGVAVPVNRQVDDDWCIDDEDDAENSGTHVVENTQILHAWHQRRNRSNSGSSTDEALELPPPMERHVVRPVPSRGITFEDEIERFNSLNLSSPLGSRTTRSGGSSSRRQRSQRTRLHLPTSCGSPQPLVWDRPMLFNSPVPVKRRSSATQMNGGNSLPMLPSENTVTPHTDGASRHPLLGPGGQRLAWKAGGETQAILLQNSAKTAEKQSPQQQSAEVNRHSIARNEEATSSSRNHESVVSPNESKSGHPIDSKDSAVAHTSPATTEIDILELRETPNPNDNSPNITRLPVLQKDSGVDPERSLERVLVAVSNEKSVSSAREVSTGSSSPSIRTFPLSTKPLSEPSTSNLIVQDDKGSSRGIYPNSLDEQNLPASVYKCSGGGRSIESAVDSAKFLDGNALSTASLQETNHRASERSPGYGNAPTENRDGLAQNATTLVESTENSKEQAALKLTAEQRAGEAEHGASSGHNEDSAEACGSEGCPGSGNSPTENRYGLSQKATALVESKNNSTEQVALKLTAEQRAGEAEHGASSGLNEDSAEACGSEGCPGSGNSPTENRDGLSQKATALVESKNNSTEQPDHVLTAEQRVWEAEHGANSGLNEDAAEARESVSKEQYKASSTEKKGGITEASGRPANVEVRKDMIPPIEARGALNRTQEQRVSAQTTTPTTDLKGEPIEGKAKTEEHEKGDLHSSTEKPPSSPFSLLDNPGAGQTRVKVEPQSMQKTNGSYTGGNHVMEALECTEEKQPIVQKVSVTQARRVKSEKKRPFSVLRLESNQGDGKRLDSLDKHQKVTPFIVRSRETDTVPRSPRKRARITQPGIDGHNKHESISESDTANYSENSFTYVSTLSPDSRSSNDAQSGPVSFSPGVDTSVVANNRITSEIVDLTESPSSDPSNNQGHQVLASTTEGLKSSQQQLQATYMENFSQIQTAVPEIVPSISLAAATENIAAPVWHFDDAQAYEKSPKPERKLTTKVATGTVEKK